MGRTQRSDRTKLRNSSPNLTRKENTSDQRAYVILACEGIETEANYFRAFFRDLKNDKILTPNSCMIAPHRHTNPTGVLDDLLSYNAGFGVSFESFEHKWIVIDRDPERLDGGGHTPEDFQSAILQAQIKGVGVAWSNPCFELWILLHYQFRETSIDRDDFSGILTRLQCEKYEKNDPLLYSKLKSLRAVAIRNSKLLWDRKKSIRPLDCNPCTKVFELFDSLLGKSST